MLLGFLMDANMDKSSRPEQGGKLSAGIDTHAVNEVAPLELLCHGSIRFIADQKVSAWL